MILINMFYKFFSTFLKELMLIRQVNQKNMTIFTIGIFYIKSLSFDNISAQGVMIY